MSLDAETEKPHLLKVWCVLNDFLYRQPWVAPIFAYQRHMEVAGIWATGGDSVNLVSVAIDQHVHDYIGEALAGFFIMTNIEIAGSQLGWCNRITVRGQASIISVVHPEVHAAIVLGLAGVSLFVRVETERSPIVVNRFPFKKLFVGNGDPVFGNDLQIKFPVLITQELTHQANGNTTVAKTARVPWKMNDP